MLLRCRCARAGGGCRGGSACRSTGWRRSSRWPCSPSPGRSTSRADGDGGEPSRSAPPARPGAPRARRPRRTSTTPPWPAPSTTTPTSTPTWCCRSQLPTAAATSPPMPPTRARPCRLRIPGQLRSRNQSRSRSPIQSRTPTRSPSPTYWSRLRRQRRSAPSSSQKSESESPQRRRGVRRGRPRSQHRRGSHHPGRHPRSALGRQATPSPPQPVRVEELCETPACPRDFSTPSGAAAGRPRWPSTSARCRRLRGGCRSAAR